MHYEDPTERHRKWRIFFGRLVELQVAEWLEHERHSVTALEAFRPGPDIETSDHTGLQNALEVKFIGPSDEDFSRILQSMRSGFGGGMGSPYGAANYLLFRVYEAAKQLETVRQRKAAVIVIDALAWTDFQEQIRKGWIDWRAPTFYDIGAKWQEFLQAQAGRYPFADDDLRSAISGLGSVLVLRIGNRFEYVRELEIQLGP